MKEYLAKLVILTTMLLLLSISAWSEKSLAEESTNTILNTQPFTLTIMHTNDTHGRVERRPKLATAVKEVRTLEPNALLLDAGDVSYGTDYYEKYLGLADLWFMNDIGYDAMTFGNHEFDKGTNVLASFVKNMKFPMVSTNVNVNTDPNLAPLFKNEISSNPVDGNIYPTIIKEVNGEKIGIIGLTTIYYSFPPIVFESPYTKASASIASLQQQGVNKIIAISHLGLTVDQKLATRVPGIDIIVGGHNHNALTSPMVIANTEPTLIVQAGQYLQYLGLLNITFNESGVIIGQNGKLLPLDNYVPDPIQQAKVEEFKYSNAQPYLLTIMHTNDSHGRVEQRPKLASAVKEIRGQKPNSLLVDAGDVFYGSAYFDKYLGKADLWFMNNLGYDAMTFGKHEFDKGTEVLADFIKNMTFPMVSANVDVTNDPYLAPLFKNEISSDPVGGNIYPTIIKEVNGQKVGIIGLTTTYFSYPPILLENPYTEAAGAVAALKQQGINKIIVISHFGLDVDQKLATRVAGIDVIVGGRNHTAMTSPMVIANTEPTLIVQAGQYLQYLGLLDVTFNDKGVVVAQDGKLLTLNNYAPDPEAQAKVNEFKIGLNQ